MEERLAPTLAVTALGRTLGVNIFRVHDVLENVRALKIAEAVLNAS
jgi:dihydropteroate synthase